MKSDAYGGGGVSFVLFVLLFVLSACGLRESLPPDRHSPTPLSIKTPYYFGKNFEIPADNPTTVEGVALGRMLFYEPRLSGNNTQSCAGCHRQEKAFTDGMRFSLGIDGKKGRKNTMMLANLLWSKRFFWNGRSPSLEHQALIPIQDTLEMHETLDNVVAKLQADSQYPALFAAAFGSDSVSATHIAKALAQFQRTLISDDSPYDRYLKGQYQPTPQEKMGMKLFQTHPLPGVGLRGGNCGDCHLGASTAGDVNGFQGFHNNGLDNDTEMKKGLQKVTGKPFDRGKFKAPSLRNIALTAPYMHDGRFATLEDVLEHYDTHIKTSQTLDPLILEASNKPIIKGEPVKLHLTSEEKAAIIAFLNMLTDSTFIRNKAFSNPFTQK